MLNEFVEKILVHERDRNGSIETTQKVKIYFNFIGQYVPPHFGEVRKKETIHTEDISKGIFIPVSSLPKPEPLKGEVTRIGNTVRASAAM